MTAAPSEPTGTSPASLTRLTRAANPVASTDHLRQICADALTTIVTYKLKSVIIEFADIKSPVNRLDTVDTAALRWCRIAACRAAHPAGKAGKLPAQLAAVTDAAAQ